MGDRTVDELMDEIEERAEDRLKLLHVLDSAQMMRVTREAILAWMEEERHRERERFGALSRNSLLT